MRGGKTHEKIIRKIFGNVVTLTEGNLTKVTIYNGHLSKKTFRIKFAGNDPDLSVYVNYYYNGK